MSQQGEKTEKPTKRRLDKARAEGQFPVAKEFVAAVQFLAVILILRSYGTSWFSELCDQFKFALTRIFDPGVSLPDSLVLMRNLALRAFLPLGYGGAILLGTTLSVQFLSTGFGFSTKRLVPSLKNLNPFSRLKQLPGQNAVSLLQAILMLVITAVMMYTLVRDFLPAFLLMPLQSVPAGAERLWDSVLKLLSKLAAVLFIFGLVDLLRTRWKHARTLRMSKQELRDEHREGEGNPEIKGRLRQLRRNMVRKQMMKDVDTATLVLINPTHYAVAIKYEVNSMSSPRVVAKGRDFLAARIRQRGMQAGVPIVENPPLARALYSSVEVGQDIPVNFYRAVAEVLAYIYKMTNQDRPRA